MSDDERTIEEGRQQARTGDALHQAGCFPVRHEDFALSLNVYTTNDLSVAEI